MPTLSGFVKDASNAGIKKGVRAHLKSTGALVGQTNSDPSTGAWSITVPTTAKHYAVEVDGVIDLDAPSLSLLMYGNGTNGGTTFTDEKGNTINRVGTVTTTSTTQSKFDGSAIYNSGTGGHINVNGSSAAFTFGTGDFTIEMWVYLTSLALPCQLLDWRPASTEGKYPAIVIWTDGTIRWHSDVAVNFVSAGTVGTGAWHHLAVTRTGGTIRLFIDGVLDANTLADSTDFLGGSSVRPCFGYGPNPGVSFPIVGYLNSIAIYKGVAKYTATFTLPDARAGDVQYVGGKNALIYDELVPA